MRVSSTVMYHREVMLSSNLYKVFENVILTVLERKCFISPLQLGYLKKPYTTDVVLIFKEIVPRYASEDSTKYARFLNFSKLFKTVDHGNLLRKI